MPSIYYRIIFKYERFEKLVSASPNVWPLIANAAYYRRRQKSQRYDRGTEQNTP